MKRTTERVLTWIGIALQLIAVIVLAVLIPMFGNSEVKDTFINQMMQEEASVTYEDANAFFSTLSGLVTVGLVISIVILIIALIAAFLIGKKAKAAGILLIITGIISLLGNWINAILWIVAGIMLLVRKPKTPAYNNDGSQVNERNNAFVLSEEDKENEKEAIKDEYTKSDEDNKYKY